MNIGLPKRTCGFSLMELMIVLALIAVFGTSLNMALEGMSGWSGKSSAEDAIADDVLRTWKTFNDDLGQGSWWVPDTTQAFGDPTFSTDRSLVYAPFVSQPAITGAPIAGQPASGRLRIFGRSGGSDVRFEGPPVADLTRLLGLKMLPGASGDRLLAPSAFATTSDYRQSYSAPSQELVFVRATNTLWNRSADRPAQVSNLAPARIPVPIDGFPGATAAWSASSNHTALGILKPSGWQRSGSTWAQIGTGPYGQVMDACYLYTGSGALDLRLQLEQSGQPAFQLQDPSQVRLFCYALIPSPNAMGLGRLVRAYTTTGALPAIGNEEGQRIATDGTTGLVIDRVISDNVVRVLFETARHANDIGINNIRATIYFARASEKQRGGQPIVIRREVTMVFTMRSANSWQDKDSARSRIKTSTTIASGAIPFTY